MVEMNHWSINQSTAPVELFLACEANVYNRNLLACGDAISEVSSAAPPAHCLMWLQITERKPKYIFFDKK